MQAQEAREANEGLRAELMQLMHEVRGLAHHQPAAGSGLEAGTQTDAGAAAGGAPTGTGRRVTAVRLSGCSLPGMPATVDGSNFQNSPIGARPSCIADAGGSNGARRPNAEAME